MDGEVLYNAHRTTAGWFGLDYPAWSDLPYADQVEWHDRATEQINRDKESDPHSD